MRVTITGASGFIGSSLVAGFIANGDQVTAIARGKDGHLTSTAQHLSMSLTPTELEPVLREGKPDVFIHCVGASTPYQAQSQAQRDFHNTVTTTADILAALRQCSPETFFILISSAAVYGDRGGILLSEDLSPEPISVYGYHKWMAEMLVQQYVSQFGLNALIVRPFSVYGEALKKQVIFDLCQKLLARPAELALRGTGKELRDFVHIDDLVAALIKLSTCRRTGLLNLATGVPTSIAELAEFIAKEMAPETRISFTGESSAGNPFSLVGSVEMIRKLKIQPLVSLEAGLSRVLAAAVKKECR